ncbi:pentapeptide repeat-containing protein, partial [bacterium]|nr:pentapeptide repeat-containing protein [bacterium]
MFNVKAYFIASVIATAVLTGNSTAQIEEKMVWPYGGLPDSSRYNPSLMDRVPVTYKRPVKYIKISFDFGVYFNDAHFENSVNFTSTGFGGFIQFEKAIFRKEASFASSTFSTTAEFDHAIFYHRTDFSGAIFSQKVNFRGAQFWGELDLYQCKIETIDLELAELHDKVFIGSKPAIKFDLTRTYFSEESEIVLLDLVDLIIQPEKVGYVSYGGVSYNLKRLIHDNLMSNYQDDKNIKFELEYLFAKSTMYQTPSDKPIENKWYQAWKWPGWLLTTLYFLTMGLGYRPFWLAYWAIGLTILFTFLYWKKFPEMICNYVNKNFGNAASHDEGEKSLDRFGTLLNCAYFSTMVLFTFRLKGDILTSFNSKQKKLIVTQWVTGLLIY